MKKFFAIFMSVVMIGLLAGAASANCGKACCKKLDNVTSAECKKSKGCDKHESCDKNKGCGKHKKCEKKKCDKSKKCDMKDCDMKDCGMKKSAASKDPAMQSVVVDPVCGMDVECKTAKNFYEYKGKKYCFCSESCKQRFVKDPGKFIGKEPK